LSFGVYVSVGFDRVDYGFGIGVGDGGAFDDVIEGGAEVVGADFVETGGAGVAIEERAVAEFEFFDYGAGMAPVDELFFDFIELGVFADHAAAGV
jgi:hypothetical protein